MRLSPSTIILLPRTAQCLPTLLDRPNDSIIITFLKPTINVGVGGGFEAAAILPQVVYSHSTYTFWREGSQHNNFFKPTLKNFEPCFWKRIFLEASKCGFLLYPIQRRNFDQIIVVRELSKGKKSRPIKVKYKNRKPMSRCCLFWGGSLSPYSPPQNILLCLRYVCRVVKKQCNSFTDMYVLADRLLFIWKMSTTLTLQWL